jgi:hypothetical protein
MNVKLHAFVTFHGMKFMGQFYALTVSTPWTGRWAHVEVL